MAKGGRRNPNIDTQVNPSCPKCKKEMFIMVSAYRWKPSWHCPCGHSQPKIKGDVRTIRAKK
jgi:hypothetical protein